jgi:5,10-methylenetetrahydrofolate reductase
LSLKTSLKERPVIYEIVPPRRDTSRFNTELRGVETVLQDSRIDAVNIPELMTRRKHDGRVHYSPTTIPPEEYALMIKGLKEPIVNLIVPRLAKEELLKRARRVVNEYGVRNLVLVGKERHGDKLPGPSVVEALGIISAEGPDDLVLGGICIFNRESSATSDYDVMGPRLTEAKRVWAKASAGCDFVTSQISFDPGPALNFLSAYRRICDKTEVDPLTVFISLTTIPTPSMLSLIEGLDVIIPPKVRKRIVESGEMGAESVRIASEVFEKILSESERRGDDIPLGLQVEQVGVNSGELSLDLLDRVYPALRRS